VTEQEQRSLAWVREATPEQIDQAFKAGELAEVLAGRDPGTVVSPDELAAMSPAEIADAAKTNPYVARRIGADQGARGPRPASILDGKSPEEIRAMHRRGDLDAMLRGED
jgi:hypothetical protein